MLTQVGQPLRDAVNMASLNPATRHGLQDRIGSIARGLDADLVVLACDLAVRVTVVRGQTVFEAG